MHKLLIFLLAVFCSPGEEEFASGYRRVSGPSFANQTEPEHELLLQQQPPPLPSPPPPTHPLKSGALLSARRKRSLAFPKGSAFVLTISIVKAIQLREPANWNLDLEFDMIWPIPKGPFDAATRRTGWSPQQQQQHYLYQQTTAHRRHRRELYTNFQLALDSHGLPGEQCILRTICEAKFLLNPQGISLIEDLIRVVFSYPSSDASTYDIYDLASVTEHDCDAMYACPLSILHLLLNYNVD